MSNIKRRVKWNKHGVSEIIGNILILGITVTLFSSIMWFVTAMPTPQEHAYADMTSDLRMDYYPSGVGWANISISHKGGQELKNDAIGIYIWVNETELHRYKIQNSRPSVINNFTKDTSWTAGEICHFNITFLGKDPSKARISLMISDTVKNSEVYTVTLNGGESGTNPSPPIIGARGTTPSPTYAGDGFSFYATVTDSNNDLNTNSVYIDASALNSAWASLKMTDSNHDGVFTAASPSVADLSWNGGIVIVNATDTSGHPATGRITLSILYKGGGGGDQFIGPFINYSSYFVNGTYPPDASGGESGGQTGTSGTTFYYIREYAAPNVITRDFDGGERVLIEVWSDSLRNLAIENSFYLFDPLTGDMITPQSSVDAFGYGGIFGTFHKYVYDFISPNADMIYPMKFRLRDNVGTVVSIADYINVGNANAPKLEVYQYNATLTKLINTEGNFNHTDSVYLKIITRDVDTSVTNIALGDIEISDYTGRYIIKKLTPAATASPNAPAYSSPLSSLFKTSPGAGSSTRVSDADLSGIYTVKINLLEAYQGYWLPRTNAYTVKLSMIADTGVVGTTAETYYSLSIQINVTAPLSTTDIIAGIGQGSYTWSSAGASWSQNSIAWFKNGERADQWTKTIIDANTKKGPTAMILTDIDGDSYKDVIVGWQDPSVAVGWYKNERVDGSQWSLPPYLIAPTFDAMPGLNNAAGTDHGSASEDVSVYSTQEGNFYPGGSNQYTSQTELAGAVATGDFDGDGDQDVVVAMMHPVVYSSAYGSGDADYTNSFGMYFNRGVWVYYNDGTWGTGKTFALQGTMDWTSKSGDNGANGNYNGAVMDMQSADMNADGYDDIVAVYQDGTTRVWLNQWGALSGNFSFKEANAFGANSLIYTVPAVSGTLPWINQQDQNGKSARLELMDMDKNGLPDIIRTSTTDNNVYIIYTRTATPPTVQNPNSVESGVATRSGSYADLTTTDIRFENLTEVYKTVSDTGRPSRYVVGDNTGQDPANLVSDGGGSYAVIMTKTMYLYPFTLAAANDGKTIESANLRMRYMVSASYTTGNPIQYSNDGGSTWVSTGFTPTTGQTSFVTVNFNLKAAGVDTYNELSNLRVRFVNGNSGTGPKTVTFDTLIEEVVFVEPRQLQWTWTIPNDPATNYHTLTVNASCFDNSESFNLQYSVDNANWITLGTISSTTGNNYTWSLMYNSGQYYYLRVTDNGRLITDVSNNTFCVNMVKIEHSHASVMWPASDMRVIAVNPGAGEFLTCIAIGDIGKSGSDYKYDSYNDIVVGTSKVGSGDTTHSLFLILHQSGGSEFEAPVYIDTSLLAAKTGTNNGLYDVRDVELGDFNGDKNLDIVLVIGFAPGRSTATVASSIYTYMNRPDIGSGQFYENTLNALDSTQSVINVETGYIDLTILLPFLGMVGVIAGEALIDRKRRKR